jgi:hypothetical protein
VLGAPGTFVVHFPADGEYWAMHERKHRGTFRVKVRKRKRPQRPQLAALSQSQSQSQSQDESQPEQMDHIPGGAAGYGETRLCCVRGVARPNTLCARRADRRRRRRRRRRLCGASRVGGARGAECVHPAALVDRPHQL